VHNKPNFLFTCTGHEAVREYRLPGQAVLLNQSRNLKFFGSTIKGDKMGSQTQNSTFLTQTRTDKDSNVVINGTSGRYITRVGGHTIGQC